MTRSQDTFAAGFWGFVLGCITTRGPDWFSALFWVLTLIIIWLDRYAPTKKENSNSQ